MPANKPKKNFCPGFCTEALDLRAWGSRVFEFMRAVIPLTLFVVMYIWLFLGREMLTADITGGMVCVIFGLAMFKFGLLTGLMTLGEVIGLKLPFRVPNVVFTSLAFALGVFVTFAEPGINSLQVVGENVRHAAPLLADVLTVHSFLLMIAIALGVGLAAAIGMQRIKSQWSIKSVIWASLFPLLALTAACGFLGDEFAVVIGLAWDCGAITTGPATVPIVLALGFGMCRTRKQLKEDPHHDERVQALLSMLDGWAHHPKYEAMRRRGSLAAPQAKANDPDPESLEHLKDSFERMVSNASSVKSTRSEKSVESDGTPKKLRERSRSLISPSNKTPLLNTEEVTKSISEYSLNHGRSTDDDVLEAMRMTSFELESELFEKFKSGGEDLDCFGIVTLASLYPIFSVLIFCVIRFFIGVHANEGSTQGAVHTMDKTGFWEQIPFKQMREAFTPVCTLVSFMLAVQFLVLREKLYAPGRIFVGVLSCWLGLTVFDIGLEHGSVPLGQGAGEILPNALSEDSDGGGIFVILIFGFVCGVIATIIDLEPCGLGETVELLSNGKFRKLDLFVSVSFGVGVGIVIGMCKIIYNFNVSWVIFPGYALAVVLTYFSADGITCVAWDSAGVTTGPVTVPLVLALGVGICNKGYGANGFGVLTCASVCPIVSVLLMGLYKLGPMREKAEET